MFPAYNSLPTKHEILLQEQDEKLQKLEKLNETIQELEKFQQFDEINELLIARKALDQNEKNIYLIDVTINKINNLIHSLIQPAQDKINQLKFLMTLIEKYFDQIQVNSINSVFARHKNKLQEEIEASFINREAIDNRIIKIEQLFTNELETILKKMRTYVQNKEVTNNYEEYKSEILKILENSDEKNFLEDGNELYKYVEFLEETIQTFEVSCQEFNCRLPRLNNLIEKSQNAKLIESDSINETKLEVQDLICCLNSFNPREKTFDTLDKELDSLSWKFIELNRRNQSELQKQQDELIRQIKVTQQDLSKYSKKLALLNTKSTNNKAQQLKLINSEIESLLNPENLEEDTSKTMADNIEKLKHTMNDAKDILSEYRGICLLRCFATLWGGGKVTSKLLVDELEVKLGGLQDNIRFLSP